ncbi:MAG: isoprenyl transferase [Alphaproteobacteria bacterium]
MKKTAKSDFETVPNHVAIIMDGNGRWATRRGLPRSIGHRQGAKALKRTVRAAGELGVKYLTLFGFSSENWNRPQQEVAELMRLLRYYLRSETAELMKNNIRLKVIGDIGAFDNDIPALIQNAEVISQENDGIFLTIALNYGGRHDIVQALGKMLQEADTTAQMHELSPDDLKARFESHLLTKDMPDPDLLIRTSGEQRISNFLLWQCAYSELYFSETLWPDFGRKDMEEALAVFQNRERRYGSISEAIG